GAGADDGAGAAFFSSAFGEAGFSATGAGEADLEGAATASPSAAIVPTTVFTPTVVPSVTLISCNTPEAGAGISASTLSVEISKRGSSRWTLSPGFFSHFVMVPSTMDSPIWGMMMSVGMISLPLGPRSLTETLRANGYYIVPGPGISFNTEFAKNGREEREETLSAPNSVMVVVCVLH